MIKGIITNAPHVPRSEAFLDSGDMVKNPVQIFERYRAKLGPTFTFHFGGTKRTIVSADPDFIQHVLKDNHQNYRKSDIQVKRMAEFQGNGLLNSHGEYWLKQRRLLSHGFSRHHLTDLLPLQTQVLNEFHENFERAVRQGSVDIHQQMVLLTLRMVGKSLFGNDMKDDDLELIGDTITEIQTFMVRQIVQPYKIPWFRISGQTHYFQDLRAKADKVVKAYVERRINQSGMVNDLLQLIIQTPYSNGEYMSNEQVMIEILQLLVAGNETSSNTLSWAFYLLARNPKYINLIREEITSVFGNEELNFGGLHQLKIALRVLDEAMRMYPPFWMIDRVAIQDDEVDNIRIPAGVTVVPYIYGVHHNTDFWKKPELFDPSRFDMSFPANTDRHAFAHVPFGGGPRVCIGQNMAIAQMLLILASFIRKFDFKLTSEDQVSIRPMMILRPEGPIMMSFWRVV